MRPLFATALLGSFSCQDYNVHRDKIRDSFEQWDRQADMDLLWVLDDSDTLWEERQQLANTTDAFIGFLTLAEIPFRLGVVTTDMEVGGGALVGGEVLTHDSTDVSAAFAALVAVDDDYSGNRDERGLETSVIGAEPNGLNPTFGRDDADLEIVYFTDEDDHSGLTASDAMADLADARPGRRIGITAIVGDLPGGCITPDAAADPGLKYAEMVELAQDAGLRESICSTDYETMLARVALKALGLVDTYYLSAIPHPGTIEVMVDGALLYERQPHGWRYDPGDNTIVFDGYAMPPPGAYIEVAYFEWYGPESELDTGGA